MISAAGQKLLYVLLTLSVINLHIMHYNNSNIAPQGICQLLKL